MPRACIQLEYGCLHRNIFFMLFVMSSREDGRVLTTPHDYCVLHKQTRGRQAENPRFPEIYTYFGLPRFA